MFDGARKCDGDRTFVLVVAVIYAALHIHHRSKTLEGTAIARRANFISTHARNAIISSIRGRRHHGDAAAFTDAERYHVNEIIVTLMTIAVATAAKNANSNKRSRNVSPIPYGYFLM